MDLFVGEFLTEEVQPAADDLPPVAGIAVHAVTIHVVQEDFMIFLGVFSLEKFSHVEGSEAVVFAD